jgi:hypothetical protein
MIACLIRFRIRPDAAYTQFHHLHLNSVDPDAAIGFYTRQFPNTAAGRWAGHKALLSPHNIMILFNRVELPPPVSPPSAIWHFGWHVTDVRGNIATYKARSEIQPYRLGDTRAFMIEGPSREAIEMLEVK